MVLERDTAKQTQREREILMSEEGFWMSVDDGCLKSGKLSASLLLLLLLLSGPISFKSGILQILHNRGLIFKKK